MADTDPPLTTAMPLVSGQKKTPGVAIFVDGKAAGRVRVYLVTGYLEFNFEIGPTILPGLAATDFQVISGDCAVSVLS